MEEAEDVIRFSSRKKLKKLSEEESKKSMGMFVESAIKEDVHS